MARTATWLLNRAIGRKDMIFSLQVPPIDFTFMAEPIRMKMKLLHTCGRSRSKHININIYIYIRSFFFSGIRSGVVCRLGLSMRFAELEFSVKSLRSRAVFGGRLKRPSPCCIRSAPRRERGRMPSETSEKLQKYRMSRRNSGDFGCIFTSAAPGWFTKLA